ncbi:MAG: tetratricopeptide repeat protein, partial [Planctomycetota bacterium]
CLSAAGAAEVADAARYELAWAYALAGRPDAAAEEFGRLAKDHADSPYAAEANLRVGEWHYRRAELAAAETRFAAAAEAGKRPRAQAAATREQALHMLGWTRFDQGRHGPAADAFAEQLASRVRGPLAADARLMLAECRFAAGDFAAAVSLYESAFGDAGAPRADLRPLGLLHAGQAAGQVGDWPRALAWLDQAMGQVRAASVPGAGGGTGQEPADKPDADADADADTDTNIDTAQPGDDATAGTAGPLPRPSAAYANQIEYERAWALHKLGRDDEATPILQRLAESDASVLAARARFVLGELQFAQGDLQQAVRTFFKVAYGYGGEDAAPAYHVWQSQALFEAARCLEQLGRGGPARKLYGEVVQRFPNSEKAAHARRRLQNPAPP